MKEFLKKVLRNKKRILFLILFFFLAFSLPLTAYFVTSDRSFDERGMASGDVETLSSVKCRNLLFNTYPIGTYKCGWQDVDLMQPATLFICNSDGTWKSIQRCVTLPAPPNIVPICKRESTGYKEGFCADDNNYTCDLNQTKKYKLWEKKIVSGDGTYGCQRTGKWLKTNDDSTTSKYKLTVTAATSDRNTKGTVVSSPAGINVNLETKVSDTVSFDANAQITLTARPSAGTRFDSWYGCDSETSTSCKITLRKQEGSVVEAKFKLDSTTPDPDPDPDPEPPPGTCLEKDRGCCAAPPTGLGGVCMTHNHTNPSGSCTMPDGKSGQIVPNLCNSSTSQYYRCCAPATSPPPPPPPPPPTTNTCAEQGGTCSWTNIIEGSSCNGGRGVVRMGLCPNDEGCCLPKATPPPPPPPPPPPVDPEVPPASQCVSNNDCRRQAPFEICFSNNCIRGDVNNDGSINVTDFSEFKKDFLAFKENGWGDALRRSDLNMDSRISMADYSIFVRSYRLINRL